MTTAEKTEKDSKPKHVELIVRATNGDIWKTKQFKINDTVGEVRDKAVKHFVAKGSMADGDYDLALIMDGQAQPPLDPDDRLEDTDVRSGSELVLVAKEPQVDG